MVRLRCKPYWASLGRSTPWRILCWSNALKEKVLAFGRDMNEVNKKNYALSSLSLLARKCPRRTISPRPMMLTVVVERIVIIMPSGMSMR